MSKKKILIVDDSKTIRQQVNITLTKGGIDVVEAEDGKLGIEALGQHADIAMVISDVNMPNMGGIEMIEALKQAGTHPTLPIIMLTTEGGAALIERAKGAGVKGWLVKPFKPEQLVAAVTKLTA